MLIQDSIGGCRLLCPAHRAVVMSVSETIEPESLGLTTVALPTRATGEGIVSLPLGLPLEEVERRYVEATLAAAKGNRTRAAQTLGVGRNTLKRKARPRPR